MSNVQLPPWLAVVLAVLALGAPTVAAWVQGSLVSKREDARWERERELQDKRWERERQAEKEEHWRDVRLAACADFVQVFHRWREVLEDVNYDDPSGHPTISSESIAEMEKLANQLREPMARIYLLCTVKVKDECEMAERRYRWAVDGLKSGKQRLFKTGWHYGDVAGSEMPDEDIPGEIYYRLLEVMREELGNELLGWLT